jgi:Arc/MetJ-type ribon-helix-helix transcriptional regulator
MDDDREQKVAEIKQRVERGEYRVDPDVVADAILRRLRKLAAERAERAEPQNECSYPDRSPSASVKLTPAGPSRTRPTHVRRTPSLAWLFGGTQTQSS